jgi:hypothetical protein
MRTVWSLIVVIAEQWMERIEMAPFPDAAKSSP